MKCVREEYRAFSGGNYGAIIFCGFIIIVIRRAGGTVDPAVSPAYRPVFCKKMDVLSVAFGDCEAACAVTCGHQFDGIFVGGDRKSVV